MRDCTKFVGLDVHKSTIAVAIADGDRMPPVSYGLIENTPEAITRLIKRLSKGNCVRFCYEAGPCGYEVHRQINALGHQCDVVAPSLIPRKAGERIKTDRRDALSLARLYRAGELTAVWVPDQEQEAMRDLVRAREDMKGIELRARQRLSAFLLRHGLIYTGKSTWTQAHFRWLEEVRLEHPVQQIVFQEYVDAVKQAQERARGVEEQMRLVLPSWNLAPAVEAISALRGVNMLTAVTVLAELGDISRFDSPRQLMAYLGLVPREHSSGASQWRGGITKTGNGHARRVLVEAAWTYRFPARKSAHLQRKAEKTSEVVQAIAWKAQKRLCHRYQAYLVRGKMKVQACTAIARELSGFIWAIVCEVHGKERVGPPMVAV